MVVGGVGLSRVIAARTDLRVAVNEGLPQVEERFPLLIGGVDLPRVRAARTDLRFAAKSAFLW